MRLSDNLYKFLKWFLILFIPSLITLISGLGALYEYDVTYIVGVISLVSTFLGSITKISDNNYYKE